MLKVKSWTKNTFSNSVIQWHVLNCFITWQNVDRLCAVKCDKYILHLFWTFLQSCLQIHQYNPLIEFQWITWVQSSAYVKIVLISCVEQDEWCHLVDNIYGLVVYTWFSQFFHFSFNVSLVKAELQHQNINKELAYMSK